MVAIGTDLLLILTSTGDELFSVVSINDLKWPWTPKIGGFSEFFTIRAVTHISRVNCAKMAKIDQDDLHTKFSALNVDFSSSSSSSPLSSTRPVHEGVKEG